jgi:pre-rRNA-processing protein RIX1
MALLQSLLATVLSPTQEKNIAYNAVHVLSILRSSNGLIDSSDDKTAHKFKVRVSALLKSKSPLLRWFGSHLVKASVESNWTVLKSHGQTWADSLLYILEIPGPTVTHQAAIQALSILFARVHGKATLTKEIATPRIPAYLKLLVSLSKSNSSLWSTILPAITRVIRLQTSKFRSQAEHVRQLMIHIIEKTYMDSSMVDRSTLQNACEAFICLHMAATKGKEADEWRITFIRTINEIDITLNLLSKDFINEDNEVVIEPSQGL